VKTVEPTPGTEEKQAHLRDYWRVVWQGRWMALTIALVVATLVAVTTFLQTPIYRAIARVEIQPRPKSISPNADFSQMGTTSWNWMAEEKYINTQLQVVRSRAVSRAVIADLGLDGSPAIASLSDPAGWLASRIKLEMLLDTYVLEVSIEDAEPRMAQLLSNSIARIYIDMNEETAREKTRAVIEELENQLDPVREEIKKLETRRAQYVRDSQFYDPTASESARERALGQLQEELTAIRISRGSREATFRAIEELERRGDSYQELPQVANDPVIQALNTQAFSLEKEIEKSSLSYRAKHPKIMAARTELDDIHRQLQLETAKVIGKIKTEYAIDKRREDDLLNQLARVREEGVDLSEASTRVTMVDTELKEARRIHDLIMSQMKDITLNQQTLMNNVRLMDEAIVPKSPVRPRKLLNMAAGILLGLILGVGTVFFVDYLDNTIKSTDDVENVLNVPLLSVVPKIRKDTSTAIKEAFQTLRTSILFASKARSLKLLLVTSSGPGEGKSSTIASLARTLASAGDRVVLMDADLRRPTVHGRFEVLRDGGLTNYLMGREGGSSWQRYLKDVPGSDNLKIMTCGPIPPNPVELFGSARFKELLDELRQSFDWVLIDSPPVAALADSVVLASMTDMVVLVIRHNDNDREMIRRSVKQIREVNANLVGAVLNNVDLKRASYKDYYYSNYTYARSDSEISEARISGSDHG